MTALEQQEEGRLRRMSQVLWDVFTGSAPYGAVLTRTLHPGFLGRLVWSLASANLQALLPKPKDHKPPSLGAAPGALK